ncbi:hypothetical protein Trydic_g9428 [Trypoxylus dichotomus]
MTFDNLHASINGKEIANVRIIHYRNENFLSIRRYGGSSIFGVMMFLQQTRVHSNILDQVLIEHRDNTEENVRIFFSTPEQKQLFLDEIASDDSSSSSGESADSGTLSN